MSFIKQMEILVAVYIKSVYIQIAKSYFSIQNYVINDTSMFIVNVGSSLN